MTLRRYVVSKLCTAFVGLSVVASYNVVAAQIGHDPGASPFRDIRLRPVPVVFAGYLSGDRGRVGAGMSNAFTVGARYEIPAGRSLLFQFNAAFLSGDRFILDPRANATSPARRTGPVKSELGLAEIGLQLRLTGAKSWRGWAPYAGTALGFMFDVNSPGDTTQSHYKFGTKLTIAGATGVRWYPSSRLVINVEARAHLWRLKYPTSFHDTNQAPDMSTVVPLNEPLNDWTLHPWFSLGIGWTF